MPGGRKFRKFFGDDLYSFEAGGCRLIVYNDALLNTGPPNEYEQWWLDQQTPQEVAG